MNKKLLVLAVTSAVAATSAYADTANVNVYGKLYPEFAIYKGSGASATTETLSTLVRPSTGTNPQSTQAVDSSNSYVGFKGDVNVGGGLKGWYQVEQAVELDTGTGTFSSRNSAAGISGGFGNVFLGKWDTVYKQLGDPVSFLGLSSGNFVSTSNMLSRTGLGSSRLTRFHERANNWIEYDTPVVGGFQFLVGYSPDEAKTSTTNANLQSFGAKWEAGPLYVALAHEIHNDFFSLTNATCRIAGVANGTSVSNGLVSPFDARACVPNNGLDSKDTATRLSVMYKFGDTTIGVDFARRDYKESGSGLSATGITNYKQNAYQLAASQKLGNVELAASVAKAEKGTCTRNGGAACNTDGLDGMQLNLGVLYNLNKQLGVFALASNVNNSKSAAYNNTPLSIQPGTDLQAFAAGVAIRF